MAERPDPSSGRAESGRAAASTVEAAAFESLAADLSARFIGLEAAQFDESIRDALRRIVQVLGVDRCTLSVVSPIDGQLRVRCSWAAGGFERVPLLNPVIETPWALQLMRAGQPLVLPRLDEFPPEAAVDRQTFARVGLKSNVTMPLLVAGRLHGALSFGSLGRERDWPGELLGRMRLLADIVCSLLARRDAETQRERALDFERLASRILSALLFAKSATEPRIVEAGLRDIARALEADRVTLWELQSDGEAFRRTHFWHAAHAPAPERLQISDVPWTVARLVADEPVRIGRLDDLPAAAAADCRTLRGIGVRSLLAMPVTVAERLVGAFTATSVQAESDWSDALLPGVRLLAGVFASLHVRRSEEGRKREAEAEAALWRERFAHVVRVHTVGEMSAALAHEMTQPLGAIENYALAARRRLAADQPDLGKVEDLLGRIVTQSARAGDVIMRMRGMVKRHELQVAPLDLRQVVDTCIDMLRGECEMLELKIEVQQPRPLPCVTADRVHVQQVLLNLLRNAVDAMAAAVADAPRSIFVTLTGCDDDAVSVQVADHGPGIPEGDLERVFEAFHSTKPLGLGVGLAICRRLIEAHGGSLRAAHRPGGGALFECTLPLLPVEV